MKIRHVIPTAVLIIGGPLLYVSQIEPKAATTVAGGDTATAAVVPVVGSTGGGAVTTMAGAAVVSATPDSARRALVSLIPAAPVEPSATLITLAEATPDDLASAGSTLPASDFAAIFAAIAVRSAAFDRPAGANENVFFLASASGVGGFGGGTTGGASGSTGSSGASFGPAAGAANADPVAFGATGQMQAVSTVPEPASWISFIVGLGLIGINMRRKPRLRSVTA